MVIKKLKYPEDLLPVYHFYYRNVSQIGYVPYDTLEEFEQKMMKNYDGEGFYLAIKKNKIVGICYCIIQKEVLPNELDKEVPGYIALLIVGEDYQRQGIGTKLLNTAEEYLKEKGRKYIRISHKCPIKFSWYIPNKKGAQHNKAPGVKVDSYGYKFLSKLGYQVDSYEVSYYMPLTTFSLPNDILETQNKLKEEGYIVDYFDKEKHIGYEEMFTRLSDESYRKKFRDGIKRNAKMLVVLKDDKEVCGCAGEIFAEINGRGYFQGLAVDPKHGGKKLGNLLFFRLCEELKKHQAQYMTLFVTEDNFAKKIYEKAGFEVVERWAILTKKEA